MKSTIRRRHRLSREAGITLVEMMVAAALLGIIAMSVSSAYLNAHKSTVTIGAQRISSDSAIAILQQTSDAFGQYQVNFTDTASGANMGGVFPTTAELPVAFSQTAFTSAANCPQCPGRIGYVIQPMTGYRGMYLSTIRVQNTEAVDRTMREINLVIGDSE